MKVSELKVQKIDDSGNRLYVCPLCGGKIKILDSIFFGRCDTCLATLIDYKPASHQVNFHKSKARYRLNLGGYGSGKLEAKTQPITTPTGDRLFGDLKVGDYVFGSNGSPTKVVGVYDRGYQEAYRVWFSDNSYLDVGHDHLWTVNWTNSHKKEFTATYETRDLKDMLGVKNKKYRIPVTGAVEYADPKKPLMDQYILGGLIADGYLGDKLYWYKKEKGVVDEFGRRVNFKKEKIKQYISKENNLEIWEALDKYNLKGKLSGEKFIPYDCFFMSVEDRILLLQGLMDSDGTPQHYDRVVTTFKYGTTSKQLAKDVVRLVTGLGGLANNTYDENDECWYVKIDTPFNPFLASSNKEKWEESVTNRVRDKKGKRYIESIERIADIDGVCIKVEAEDELYIGDNQFHIVTHNTTMGASEVASHALDVANGKTVIVAQTLLQVKEAVLTELDKFIPTWFIKRKITSPLPKYVLHNGHEILVFASNDEEKLRSLNLTAFWIVEASGVDYSVFTQLQTRLRNPAAVVKDKNGVEIEHKFMGIVESNPEEGWIRDEFLLRSSVIKASKNVDITSYDKLKAKKEEKAYHSFLSATPDNPFLHSNFISDITAGKDERWIRKYIYCYLEVREGAVYPEFMNCLVEPFAMNNPHRTKNWLRICGFDKGWTDDTSLLIGAVDPVEGVLYIYDEYSEAEKPITYHATKIKEKTFDLPMYKPIQADPSVRNKNDRDGVSYSDYFRNVSGITFDLANNSIFDGIERVRDYMYTGKLKIFTSCIKLREEAQKYVYKKNRDGTGTDDPIDRDNHLMDCLRYLVMSLPTDLRQVTPSSQIDLSEATKDNLIHRIRPDSDISKLLSGEDHIDGQGGVYGLGTFV